MQHSRIWIDYCTANRIGYAVKDRTWVALLIAAHKMAAVLFPQVNCLVDDVERYLSHRRCPSGGSLHGKRLLWVCSTVPLRILSN